MNITMILTAMGMVAMMSSPAFSNEPTTGLEVMKLVEARDDGKDLTQKMMQRLVDKRGNVRERRLITFSKDYGLDSKSVSYFLSPANIRDTSMLTWDYADEAKDDDQWLYLPALKKVRRISSSDRGDYFMGTDFTFEDIKATPELGDYNWTLMGSEMLDGKDVWVVEAIPKSKQLMKDLGYSKVVYHVRKDIDMYIKVDFWDRKGRELKHLISTGITQIDGIWTATGGVMKNVQTNHRTELVFSEQEYNTGLSDRMFTERMIKRGYRGK
ncbi:MAG TPA: outer membrane lipoprotein-sorting protein [Ghiorsea sp.]|nr:outer membrane lipoprotein-sorting protein [Ghiorsea sp.]HIP06677.1 outer membrane lipoprotein-sorting protein [Mariprofundaceae bacterium]